MEFFNRSLSQGKTLTALFSFTLLFSLFSSQSLADEYYSSDDQNEFAAGALTDSALTHRVKVASGRKFHALGYSKRAKKELFGFVELESDNEGRFVFDVYCRDTIRNGVGPNRIPNNSVMNTEHTWPQSLGAKSEPKRGDLHHLFPTNSRANSTRGNHPFGEVDGDDAHHACSASQAGHIINPRTGKKSSVRGFQPPPEHRGNLARAMFYFAVRYGYQIDALQEHYLRKWHNDDPVDDREELRNDKIEQVQGNRNPFIDYPRLVDRITDF